MVRKVTLTNALLLQFQGFENFIHLLSLPGFLFPVMWVAFAADQVFLTAAFICSNTK